jgi:hypothetical protein
MGGSTMRTNHALCIMLLLTGFLVQYSVAQSNAAVVLRGNDYAFSISMPPGWTLDTTDRAEQAAAKAVLCSMEQGKLVSNIGILIATKKVEGKSTLPNLLSYRAHEDSIEGVERISPPQTLLTKDKKKAILVTKVYKNIPYYAAYIEEAGIVAVFATWRREQSASERSLSAFKEVVQSYSSVSVPYGPTK